MLEEARSSPRPRAADAQPRRVQVRHFSSAIPGMTIDDGYAIQRAWVKTGSPKAASSRAARSASPRARCSSRPRSTSPIRTAARRHVLRAGGGIPFERFIAPRVEVELAFILGRPCTART